MKELDSEIVNDTVEESKESAETKSSQSRCFWLARKCKLGIEVSTDEAISGASWVFFAIATWACLYLAIGGPFLPNEGSAWAIMLIWICALAAGALLDKVYIPAPLGMLLAGMALVNINQGSAIAGLKSSWSSKIRGMALAVIFLRSGLELDLGVFRRVGFVAFRLLMVPGICETFFAGGIAILLFSMPATFGFALGSILNAVGPALVVQCMTELQERRLGIGKDISSIVVAAAGFDDAIAITLYTIFINIAVTGDGDEVWNNLQGPLSIVFGILAGIVAALFCAPTRIWNNTYKRVTVVLLLALLMSFFFNQFGFTSGGAIAALILGMLLKEFWSRGWFALGGTTDETKPLLVENVERHIRWFWGYFMSPLLFGLVGATMNFHTLPDNTIPRACAIVAAGLAVRIPITFLTMVFGGFSFKEKLFFAIAWTPKATVQASLGALPLDQVNRLIPKSSPQYAEYSGWAEDTLVTSVFCILICGTFGTLATRYLSPFLLDKAPETDCDLEEQSQTALPRQKTRRWLTSSYKHLDPVTPWPA